jgi:hypothetical protein
MCQLSKLAILMNVLIDSNLLKEIDETQHIYLMARTNVPNKEQGEKIGLVD